jgi:hypothetical protein
LVFYSVFFIAVLLLINIFIDCSSREEIEKPETWAQICIQRLVELAKESTTMRRVLDPMFVYFDSRQHWAPQNGLAMMVLSSMAYFIENTGIALSYHFDINCF